MEAFQLERYRAQLEESISYRDLDFCALYMSVCSLHALVKEARDLVRSETVATLKGVLTATRHRSQTRALFLYKEEADALASIAVYDRANENLAQQAIFGPATGAFKHRRKSAQDGRRSTGLIAPANSGADNRKCSKIEGAAYKPGGAPA
ncbi:MAG: hypothetical protein RBS57_06050 [Desulforhabdus sp.]|jgi:hypothetical protein|nr:hypothetical protein [Desulforhabdus sp.]